MDLISILIALALDQTDLRHTSKRLLSTLADYLCGGWGMPGLIAVISVVFLGHALLRTLSPVLEGVFNTIILVICVGMGELMTGVGEYLMMRSHDDEEGARHVASALVERDVYSSGVRLTREVLAGVLVEGHARTVGVLFWYLILGPAGALLAALSRRIALPTCTTKGHALPMAGTLYWGLDWLPARLSALSYGLAGSLTHAISNWRARTEGWNDPNTVVLVTSGTGALLLETETSGDPLAKATPEDQNAAVESALALVMRALAVWVTAVALVTLGGWLK
ncbi:putative cobalamin biosynthesis protein CobD [Gammaproteobacteria bacterium]